MFESRTDIQYWVKKIQTMQEDLDTLLNTTVEEPCLTVAEHNELCKAATHLEHFYEAFCELEARKMKGSFYLPNEDDN
jgi:homoserine trans-succinylase